LLYSPRISRIVRGRKLVWNKFFLDDIEISSPWQPLEWLQLQVPCLQLFRHRLWIEIGVYPHFHFEEFESINTVKIKVKLKVRLCSQLLTFKQNNNSDIVVLVAT